MDVAELEAKAQNIAEKIKSGDHQFVNEFFATQKQRHLQYAESQPTAERFNQIVDNYNMMANAIHQEFDDHLQKTTYGNLKSNIDWEIKETRCTCSCDDDDENEAKQEMKAVLRGFNKLIIQEKKNEKEEFKQAFKNSD